MLQPADGIGTQVSIVLREHFPCIHEIMRLYQPAFLAYKNGEWVPFFGTVEFVVRQIGIRGWAAFEVSECNTEFFSAMTAVHGVFIFWSIGISVVKISHFHF
jgi:hypothetical protein